MAFQDFGGKAPSSGTARRPAEPGDRPHSAVLTPFEKMVMFGHT